MNNYAGPGGPEFIEKQADDFINGAFAAHGALAEMPDLESKQTFTCSAHAASPAT